jgi:hypothetical protein
LYSWNSENKELAITWTCSLGIQKQFGGETRTAIRRITKEIANNDMIQLTKFGKSDLHSITNPLFQ